MSSLNPTPALIRPLRFGPDGRFDLRPAEYRLLVDGQVAPLGGRALDLLLVLAARPGELVTKGELLEQVWPGLVVEENNLRVQVNGLRRLLGDDAIATVPGRGYRFAAPVLADPGTTPVTAPSAVLPAHLPRLFGRDADLRQLEQALHGLATERFVTVIGTSGVGKSSLARLVAARWHGDTHWIDLAPLVDGDQVAGAVGRALQIDIEPGDISPLHVRAAPDGRPTLLVLDNAEHVLAGCATMAPRLAAAPALRLLVTSQVPLALGGEQIRRLDPLALPAADGAPEDEAQRDGAFALLVDRISAADRRFEFPPASLPLLASLCRQLDGLPLALEMAAARVPLMGLRAVHDALAERFALLSRGRRDSPARHRSLQAALAWSYGLLDEPEQRLFRALGSFAGGFTLDLALMTLSHDEGFSRWDVVDGLAALVERSLVNVDGADPPRYRLLETMRAFALNTLDAPADRSERRSLRQRHAAAVLALFSGDASEPQCLAEMANAREAFLWARENDLGVAAQLATCVARVVAFTPWRQEVTDWMLSLQPQMAQPPGRALPHAVQADWWSMLAFVLNVRRDAGARPAAAQAVALWRPLGHPAKLIGALGHWVRSIHEAGPELDEACAELQQALATAPTLESSVRAHGALAEAARLRGDSAALLACREQELLLSRELGWADMAQAAETNVCAALVELGRPAEAAERGLALLERIDADGSDDNGNLPWALNVVVEALTALGRLDEARALVPRSLAAGRRFGTTVAWQGILGLALAQARPRVAARLAGFVRLQWAARGDTPDRDEQRRWASCQAAVETTLGQATAAALVAEGRSMDEAAAAALAAGASDSLPSAAAAARAGA